MLSIFPAADRVPIQLPSGAQVDVSLQLGQVFFSTNDIHFRSSIQKSRRGSSSGTRQPRYQEKSIPNTVLVLRASDKAFNSKHIQYHGGDDYDMATIITYISRGPGYAIIPQVGDTSTGLFNKGFGNKTFADQTCWYALLQ